MSVKGSVKALHVPGSPLDPDLPICDAHHHLWYNNGNEYRVEDYLQDISGGHRVLSSVFIESRLMLDEKASPAMQPVGETAFVRRVIGTGGAKKSQTKIARGIIGFADLTMGAPVARVLEAHITASGGRFRGIRFTTAWDASPLLRSRWNLSPHLLLDSAFREGFALLSRYHLSFDAWLYHPQLLELVDLARAFPDISIIVDHCGGPLGIGPYASDRAAVFENWRRGIRELASCPNVFMKLGGLGMRINGFGWKAENPPDSATLAQAFKPYFTECIEHFGVRRCMFESNFPVDKASYSFTVLWNAFKKVSADYSPDERLALFHDTAVKVYRLN